MSTARPFRRAADRARMPELDGVIGKARRLLGAEPPAPDWQLNRAMDEARTAATERLRILARNRPPNKSRKRT